MSVWSSIKYAINSTLGTEDFKPLDKMYKDSLQLQGTTAAISETHQLVSSSSPDPVFVIGNYGGIVNVCVNIARTNSNDFSTTVKIYKNGKQAYSQGVYSTTTDEQKAKAFEYIPISVSPGDSIAVTWTSVTNCSGTWHLCGSLSPTGVLIKEAE